MTHHSKRATVTCKSAAKLLRLKPGSRKVLNASGNFTVGATYHLGCGTASMILDGSKVRVKSVFNTACGGKLAGYIVAGEADEAFEKVTNAK